MKAHETATFSGAEVEAGAGLERALDAAAKVILPLEVGPANEASRIMITGFVAAKTGNNPELVAGAFGISTLVIEGLASMAVARQLTSDSDPGVIRRALEKLSRTEYNAMVEAGLAMIGGAAISTAYYSQFPGHELTTRGLSRRGLAVSTALGAVCAAEAYGVSAGVSSGDPKLIGASVVTLGAVKVIGDKLTETSRVLSAATHIRQTFDDRRLGPQIEGLSADELSEALSTSKKDSVIVRAKISGRKKLPIPILVPPELNGWLNLDFIKNKGEDGLTLYFSANPELVSRLPESSRKNIMNQIRTITRKNGRLQVIFDHPAEDAELYEQALVSLIPPELAIRERYMGDSEGEVASQIHFEGKVTYSCETTTPNAELSTDSFRKFALDERGDRSVGAFALSEEESESVVQELWDIYNKPFAELMKEDPLRTALSFEEFSSLTCDPGTINMVYRDSSGKILSFMQLSDIRKCSWLDSSYYSDKYPEEAETGAVWYFPGVVTSKEVKGAMMSYKLVKEFGKLVAMLGIEPVIVFECSDLSATYIPKIVEKAISGTDNSLELKITEGCRYNYRSFVVEEMPSS